MCYVRIGTSQGRKNISSHAHKTDSWYLLRIFSKFPTCTFVPFIWGSSPGLMNLEMSFRLGDQQCVAVTELLFGDHETNLIQHMRFFFLELVQECYQEGRGGMQFGQFIVLVVIKSFSYLQENLISTKEYPDFNVDESLYRYSLNPGNSLTWVKFKHLIFLGCTLEEIISYQRSSWQELLHRQTLLERN